MEHIASYAIGTVKRKLDNFLDGARRDESSSATILNRCRFGRHHPKLTAPGFRTPSG